MVRAYALAVLCALGAGVSVHADPAEPIVTLIRVYNGFGVSPRDLAGAQAAAAAIFAAGGIDVQWRICGTARPHGDSRNDPCTGSPGAAEVSARLLRSRRDDEADASLGVSLIDTDRDFGVLATVFPDRVQALARRSAVPYSVVLGRAIAHEIGHLLLGTTAHSPQGVMRPRWSPAVLRAHAAEDWAFSPDEVVRIVRSLRTRAEVLPVSSLAGLSLP